MKSLYLSSPKMTVNVIVNNGRVETFPPIVKKFKGQPIENLIAWMQSHGSDDIGGFIMVTIVEDGFRD
jgi:hypothetical protein